MADYTKKIKRNFALVGALGLGLAGVGLSANASHVMANADDTNQNNLSQATATDIPDDTSANWQTVDGFQVDEPRTNSQGSYAYCIDAGKSGMTKYSGQIQALQGLAGNVICEGQAAAGKQAQYAPLNQYDEGTRVMITQYAVWIALGEGNAPDTGIKPQASSVTSSPFYQKYQGVINGLVNYAKSQSPVKVTPGSEQAKIDQAQKQLDQQAQDDVNNQVKQVSAQIKADLTNQQNTDLQNGLQNELNQASKALHITPVAVQNSQATKTKLGAKFDGDDAKGHLDDIQNGSHDFTFKISHDNVPNTNWDSTVKVHFQNALPAGTEIVQDGKVITKDASKSQDYNMNFGDYTVKIPFSDDPAVSTDSLHATASLNASYTAKSLSKSQEVSSNKSTTVSFNLMGLGAGYKDPDNNQGQRRAVAYMVATPSTKQLTANAKQTASVTLPTKTGNKGGSAEADYSFTWHQMLGRIVVDKLGVPYSPDSQAKQQIDDAEKQNDFANGFHFNQKPSSISPDGSDSNFTKLAPSDEQYQNGGNVNPQAQANANNSTIGADGKVSTNGANSSQSGNSSTDIKNGVLDPDTNKVVKLSDVTFQLVPRTVKDLNVLKQFYPLSDGNGSQITLPKVTDNNGQLVWDNIPYGSYDLIEVQTSTGYVLNRQPIQVGADRYHVGTNNVIVKNSRPHTDNKVSIHTIAKNDTNGSTHFNTTGDTKTHDEVAIQAPAGSTGKIVATAHDSEGGVLGTVTKDNVKGTGSTETIEMPDITVNGKDVKGNIVWTEHYEGKTSDNQNISADYNNMNDTAETLTRGTSPWVHTTAMGSNGTKYRQISNHETDIDTVANGGMPKGDYVTKVVAFNPETGTPVDSSAPAGEKQFTIDQDGETKVVDVPYTFDGTRYKGNIVFVEQTFRVENGKVGEEVAGHNDMNDKGETVLAPTTGTGTTTPVTGTGTGSNSGNGGMLKTTTPTSPSTTVPTGYGEATPQAVATPLQQTGEQNNNKGIVGMFVGAIGAMFGALVGFMKRKHE